MTNKNTAPTFVVSTGTVKTSIDAGSESAKFVLFQPDGKIVVAGYSVTGSNFDLALVRYSRNGSLDPSFSGDGLLSADFDSMQDVVTGFAIQPDGKFLVAIGTGFLVRYNSDGSIDSSFGYGGKLTTSVGAINLQSICLALQPDGKILVGGVYWRGGLNGDFGLIRFNSDGNADINFGERGVVTTDINKTYDTPNSIAVQPDGKILLAGYAYNGQHDIALVRYLNNGTLDAKFSDDGKVLTDLGTSNDIAYGVAFQSDGKIIVSGSSGENQGFTLVRYADDGSLDFGFSGDGVVKEGTNFAASVIVQSDGKILATGGTGLMRYFPDGSRDIDFDATVVVPSGNSYQALAVQSNAGFIAAGLGNGIDGLSNIVVTSFKNSGEPDKLFGLPVDTLSGSIGYSENLGAVTLSSSVQIDDPELAAFGSFNGSTLTLSRQGRSNVQDVFSNTGTLSVLNQGSFFSVDGVTIGRVTANNSGSLVLSFNSNATQSLVNKAMQKIAYQNTSDAPPSSVFIDWTFNDGNSGGQGTGGALSVTGTTTVNITATNDVPYLAIPVPDQRLEVDQFFTYQLQDKTFIDLDLETLINSISMADGTGLPPWLTFNRATNTLSGTPSAEDLGNFAIQIKATDSAGASAYDYMNLIVDQKTVPSIAVSSSTSDLTVGSSAIITFTLSKSSTTFTASDVTVKGGTLSNFIGSGTNYTALFTPTANSTANGVISVASGVFTDAVGNANTDGSDNNNTITLAVDTVVPTIALSASNSSLIAGGTTTLTFTLSEFSTTFAASDITVTGGTLSNFSGNGISYTALFTSIANGTTSGSVSVASGVFTDAAGNANADGLDANNKIVFDVPGNKVWTRLLGSSGDDYGYSLTTGLDGSIYISGYTTGSLDGQANSGGEDGFVTKYSPDGVKVWTRLIGSKGDDRVWSLTTGLDGSIYLSGETTGSLDGQANNGGTDGFVAKYSPEGVKLWTRQIGSSKDDYSADLTIGLDGFIYVSGGTAGSLDGKINSGGLDAFLTKYNPDGSKVWTQWLETSGDDIAGSITTGIDGSVYLAGQTRVITDGKTSFDDYDAFVTKYSSKGVNLWTQSIATDRGDQAWAITTGLDGAIYVSGFTYGALDGRSNSGYGDGFVTKYSPNGVKVWTQLLGTSNYDEATALTTGLDGSIYVSGYTFGSLDGQVKSGSIDGFVTKFNSDGTKVWTRLIGNSWDTEAYGLTTGLDGSIYVSGFTTGSLDGQVNKGGIDAFLIKFKELDAIPTFSISVSNSLINEGSSAVFTLTTTNLALGTSVPYTLSGVSAADISGGLLSGNAVINSSGVATISVSVLNDSLTEGSETLTVTAGGVTASTLINDTSKSAATYSLNASSPSINEGSSVTFTLSTANLDSGTPVPYTLSGINSADISGGLLSGNAVINVSGVATVFITLLNDLLTESQETLTITAGGATASTVINDTSKSAATYSLNASSPSINEGSSATFTLSTANLESGTSVPYTLSGINSADISGGVLSGNAVINSSGVATISVSVLNDSLTEGSETLTVTAGGVTASTVINDTSKSVVTTWINAGRTSANEGELVSFVLLTIGIPADTSVPYTISGISSADIAGGKLTGNAVINSGGVATISVTLLNDSLTEGSETLTIGAGGASASIEVMDTSTSKKTALENHNLSVVVDKGVLGVTATLLKNLVETIVFVNGVMTKHTIQYAGNTFDYDSIDHLITTVTRDGEFTAEFTKEINDYVGNELNISYSSALKLVGVLSIDAVMLSVAGDDGKFVE